MDAIRTLARSHAARLDTDSGGSAAHVGTTCTAASIDEPGEGGERITNLDAIRGVAVLGILIMNVVSFGLDMGPYYNLASGGSVTWLDWAIGGFGEVFANQKFMGLFSMLFGSGIVIFADRASLRGGHPIGLSLWRNGILLGIGLLHGLFWGGDVLVVYAMCAPLLIAARNLRPGALIAAGVGILLLSPLTALLVAPTVGPAGEGLGELWFMTGRISGAVSLFLRVDFYGRALGMMLIGVALLRLGIMSGERSDAFYRRAAFLGLGIGLPLSALGLAFVASRGFSPDVALLGRIPNTLATVPVAIGYLSLITLWNRSDVGSLQIRVQAVGRMALTNYLTQTVAGLCVFGLLLARYTCTRTALAVFVIAVWGVQLLWSCWWLSRFRYGPAEWAWRCATYRSWQPLRRPTGPFTPE